MRMCKLTNRESILLSALVLVFGLIAFRPAGAQVGDPVLGQKGRSYRLLQGSYAQLMGVGSAGAERPALGLQVTEADGLANMWIVPGTENYVPGRTPGLIYQQGTDTVFLLWESQLGGIHSLLNLTAFRNEDGFSDVFEISGSPYTSKLDPQFLVVRDRIGLTHGADSAQTDRTVVHMVWREPSGTILYSPVLLVGGSFDWTSVRPLRLDTLFGDGFGAEAPAEDPDRRLTLQPGADSRSVIVGTIDGTARQLETVEIRVLPGALSELADAAHDSVAGYSGPIEDAAADARAHIIHIGRMLDAGAVGVLAGAAGDFVDGFQGWTGDYAQVAADARAHIIHIGARLDREGLVRAHDGSPTHLLHAITIDSEGNQRSHDLELRRAAQRPLPDALPTPDVALISPDGSGALLVWNEGDRAIYCESQGDGWTDTSAISLSADRLYSDVLELLSRRYRAR